MPAGALQRSLLGIKIQRRICVHICTDVPSRRRHAACRNSLSAAWVLSSLSSSRALRSLLPVILLATLLSLWTLLYTLIPSVRSFGDTIVLQIHDALPDSLQDGAAQLWHILLPTFMLRKVRNAIQLRKGLRTSTHAIPCLPARSSALSFVLWI